MSKEKKLHINPSLNKDLLIHLMKIKNSNEVADNRFSLFSAQGGKYTITQKDLTSTKNFIRF